MPADRNGIVVDVTDSVSMKRPGRGMRLLDVGALITVAAVLTMIPSVDSAGLSALGTPASGHNDVRPLDTLAEQQVALMVQAGPSPAALSAD